MTSTLTSYALISSRMASWLKSTSAEPKTAAEIKTYSSRIPSIKTIDAFLKDDQVYRFAMKAFGLEDMTYAKAFMRKVLAEGVDSRTAFAMKLSDRRYREFATAFNFDRYGTAATTLQAARKGTVDRYIRQTLEETAGDQNANVRLALYFQRTASGITSPYQILADKALTKVVYTALGIPETMSASDIDAQARLIENRIDFADFKSPAKLDRFIAQFAAKADAEANTSVMAAGGVGLGTDLLLAVQSARMGTIKP